jgi:hypothetical protein
LPFTVRTKQVAADPATAQDKTVPLVRRVVLLNDVRADPAPLGDLQPLLARSRMDSRVVVD